MTRHTMSEKSDPIAEESPIGKSVFEKRFDVKYAPGIRIHIMESALCKKEKPERPMAQKYPLKLN